MEYHLYYTTNLEILEAQYRANKLLLLSYAYNELDDALGKLARSESMAGSHGKSNVTTAESSAV